MEWGPRLARIWSVPVGIFASVVIIAAISDAVVGVHGLAPGLTISYGGLSPVGPAAAAGVRADDVIVAANGVRFAAGLTDEPSLRDVVFESGGRPITLTVERHGGRVELVVQPAPLGGGGWHLGLDAWRRDALVRLPLPAALRLELAELLEELRAYPGYIFQSVMPAPRLRPGEIVFSGGVDLGVASALVFLAIMTACARTLFAVLAVNRRPDCAPRAWPGTGSRRRP